MNENNNNKTYYARAPTTIQSFKPMVIVDCRGVVNTLK